MTRIECFTENCEFNICNKCNANIVNFDEKGTCLTHQKRAGGLLAQSFADIEAGEDFDMIDKNSDIKCDNETCKFNCCSACELSDIKVDDGLIKTTCISKQKRKRK